MSTAMQILDLGTRAVHVGPSRYSPLTLPGDMRGPVTLITDYGAAPFGVETLPVSTRQVAPVVEKHLRDHGDIDGLAHVILHDEERQGEMVRAFYTAIPVADFMRYRGWTDQHPDHVLVFPLAEALLATARRRALEQGVLAFVHDSSIDILVLADRTPVAGTRLHLFDSSPDEYRRLADAILQLWQSRAGIAQGQCMLIEARPGAAAELAAALDHSPLSCRAQLEAAELFSNLKPARADSSLQARLLHLCSRALPATAALVLSACLLAAGTGLYWRTEARTLQAQVDRADLASRTRLHQELTTALAQARTLEQSQHDLAEFVRLFDQVSRVPDPATLIEHLRRAAPANIAVTEAGIIAEEAGTLIVVEARSNSVAAPFNAERQFVHRLQQLGYQVVRREIEGGVDSSVFRLALTWSDS